MRPILEPESIRAWVLHGQVSFIAAEETALRSLRFRLRLG